MTQAIVAAASMHAHGGSTVTPTVSHHPAPVIMTIGHDRRATSPPKRQSRPRHHGRTSAPPPTHRTPATRWCEVVRERLSKQPASYPTRAVGVPPVLYGWTLLTGGDRLHPLAHHLAFLVETCPSPRYITHGAGVQSRRAK